MKYLHLFDPWKFPLCTCPQKYSVDPYTGCEHCCIYCYITSYIREPWKVRPKKDFLKYFERDLKKAVKMPISMSNSSDPYPKMEKEMRITRGAIELMKRYDFPLLLLTKSDIVVRDADLIEDMRSVVAITITTLDNELARKLEPYAPSPERRIKAIESLITRNIGVIVRFDPIIPTINDSEEKIKEMVKLLSELGVVQIISSTYKAKRDNFLRLTGVFKQQAEKLKKLYYVDGNNVQGIRYAPIAVRMRVLKRVRDEAKRYGIPFSVCREGLPLNTAPTCDGSHFFERNI